MDHFARPDDELAVALDTGNLHRNFQGYSTRAGADVVAFGVSGISQLDGAYTQNIKGLPAYYDRIDAGRLATYRGYEVTQEDRIRRFVIMSLMCDSQVVKTDVEDRFGIDFDAMFADALEALRPMVDDDLVTITEEAIVVEPEGRLFIRNAAMTFDAYLQASKKRPLYSKTV
jgi:oxygen-independent coproporphyrinogen-3 oxidase